MKKFFILLVLSVAFCSCGTLHIPRSVSVGYLDFEKYSHEGVLISMSPYSGEIEDHTPLGEIFVVIKSEVATVKKTISSPSGSSDLYGSGGRTITSVEIEDLKFDDAIPEMVAQVKMMGGNAIFQFSHHSYKETINPASKLERDVIIISGFAVKLK